jgi:hypothetical protein
MEVDHLVSPPVPNKDYEGTVVRFGIVINESWYALIELLPHAERIAMLVSTIQYREGKKNYGQRILILITTCDNHVAGAHTPIQIAWPRLILPLSVRVIVRYHLCRSAQSSSLWAVNDRA